MLRQTLLFLSAQPRLRHWAETSALAGPLTRRFVAGTTLDDVIRVCREINGQGIATSLDHLGENVTSAAEAGESRDQALEGLTRIADQRLNSTVSIKLTQFGLDLGTGLCLDNVAPLMERARDIGTRVEIDMESTVYTDRTLEIVTALHQRFGCVRAVIQAYLRRSEADIRLLSEASIPVRLCKGAYNEDAAVAYPEKAQVDENYRQLARLLLEIGTDPALATHDDRMVAVGKGHPADKFEYQMLYGVRRDLQRRLVAEGYRLRLYVPYGDAWYPYFMRRLAERPANLLFLAKSLFRN